MVDTITSHDASSGGNVVNQSVFEFNDAGLLTKEFQEHSGAKDGSTPYVGYNYDETASSGDYTKGLRPTSVRYPNGRLVHTTYGATDSTADAINRVAAINADSSGSPGTALADYSYLGAGAIIEVDYTEPDLRYDLAHGAGDDPYDGLDRFGRVVDLLWYDYGSSADAVRIQHGYDRAGSRLYREDPVASAAAVHLDELYGYDAANRLTAFDRGNLNGTQDALVAATKNFAQAWSLDPVGNWSGFQQDDDGDSTWDLDQSRTSNTVNKLTNITETAGPSWVTPAYNRAGNMTTIPQPSDPTQAYTGTYDAWNRLAKIADGGATVAEYAYDGAKRRTLKKTYSGGSLDETRHYYYNEPSRWQVLEERVDASTSADRHFLWGLRYADDLILRDCDTSSPANGTLNERLYALQDPNWNLVALADTSGSIQERYSYTAYGAPRVLTPAFLTRATSSYAWEIRYAGYRWDAEIEMYQVRNRVLACGLGWLQRDPLGYFEGMNLFLYVSDRPILQTDPFGLLTLPCTPAQFKLCSLTCKSELPPPGKKLTRVACHVRKTLSLRGWVLTIVCTCFCKQKRTCSDAEYDTLRGLVVRNCELPSSRGKACRRGMLKTEALINANRFKACADSRTALSDRCYGGANAGHNERARNARTAALRCLAIAADPLTPGPPGGPVFA